MSPKIRAERLMALYRLRAQVSDEITALEDAIAREAAAIGKVRESTHRPYALCGTESGYAHHRRIKKDAACGACKMAHSAYERERSRRRRAEAS